MRERIAYAGDVLEIPPAEVRTVLALPDAELGDQALIGFACEHGISLDWLMGGEIAPMMRALAARRTAHKHDPAVAAYHKWLGAYGVRHDYDQRAPEMPDDDATLDALIDAEDEAAEKLAGIIPTSPEGAAGQLHVLLVLSGCADFADDWRDVETFDQWTYSDARDGRCARSLMHGLRGMRA